MNRIRKMVIAPLVLVLASSGALLTGCDEQWNERSLEPVEQHQQDLRHDPYEPLTPPYEEPLTPPYDEPIPAVPELEAVPEETMPEIEPEPLPLMEPDHLDEQAPSEEPENLDDGLQDDQEVM